MTMKFFLKYIAPVFAILWLAKAHSLGAVLAILLCVIRCAFKSRVFTHVFSHFIYDVMKGTMLGLLKLAFRRNRN
jgi:hypothetical protein